MTYFESVYILMIILFYNLFITIVSHHKLIVPAVGYALMSSLIGCVKSRLDDLPNMHPSKVVVPFDVYLNSLVAKIDVPRLVKLVSSIHFLLVEDVSGNISLNATEFNVVDGA